MTSVITIYQTFFSILLKNILGVGKSCRFEETCSDYSKRMINEKGLLKGSYLSLVRLSRCQPFYKGNLYGNI